MDVWSYIFSPSGKEVSATLLLVAVVISIFTGILVPGRTHRRELDAANKVATSFETALHDEQALNKELVGQNTKLLAGVRIADHFYGDFLEKAPPEVSGT